MTHARLLSYRGAEVNRMKTSNLIIGVGGHVASIDPTTGTELWRTKLKGSDIVTVVLRDGRIYAGAKGQLFCLDGSSGSILWRNTLKGLGFGLVAFGGDQEVAAAETILAQRHAAAAAAASS
jgi:outer membrane protein assembly factor BamB